MPSAKGSGKKLSKAQKEKKRREEEERRRQQEEEDRLRFEMEERERIKREKTEAEERRKREKEEMKIRVVQLAETRLLLGGYREAEAAEARQRRQARRWERYLRCDGTPDPTVLPQINTFMNVWREDSARVLIHPVLEDASKCLELIAELEENSEQDKAELEERVLEQYAETASSLRQLLHEKLGRACYEMLRQGVMLADSETANLQCVWRSEEVMLCLWGNLSKNPRIRSFEFAEAGIGFDIPKALTKVGCAYQFLLTNYDHFSPQSPSFKAIPVAKPEEPEEPEEPEQPEQPEGEEAAPEGEEQPEPVEKEPTLDLMAELYKADADETEAEPQPQPEEEEEELEPPEEDLRVSPIPLEFEDFDGEEDAMDLRGYHTLGPIINFDILQIPAQPLDRRGWTIRQHQQPPQPVSFGYTPEPIVRKELGEEAEERESNTATELSTSLQQPQQQQQQQAAKKVEPENPPIQVSYQLPRTVFFAEEPKVARWDAVRCEWRTDGIEVTKFDEKERQLQFRTSVFGSLALLQDFHINMPFQTWELRPLGQRSCQLTIVASINELSLMVKEDQVCLAPHPHAEGEEAAAEDLEAALGRAELAHLEGSWMSLEQLVRSLRAAGVNVFPREDSFKHVDVPAKSRVAEEMLYEQMALLSPAFAFSWSRWNADHEDRDTLVLQACEHLNDSAVNEDAYSLFAFTRRHVRRLKMKEFDEEFSDEVDEAVSFNSEFYHLFLEVASEEAKARVEQVDFRYLATVRSLLMATRPLVFA